MSTTLFFIPCKYSADAKIHVTTKDKIVKTIKELIGDEIEIHQSSPSIRCFFPVEKRKVHEKLLFACDETGLLKNLKYNERASLLCGNDFTGNVVMFTENEEFNCDEIVQLLLDFEIKVKDFGETAS